MAVAGSPTAPLEVRTREASRSQLLWSGVLDNTLCAWPKASGEWRESWPNVGEIPTHVGESRKWGEKTWLLFGGGKGESLRIVWKLEFQSVCSTPLPHLCCSGWGDLGLRGSAPAASYTCQGFTGGAFGAWGLREMRPRIEKRLSWGGSLPNQRSWYYHVQLL